MESCSGRVLIVDDESSVRLLLARELSDLGFDVATSNDAHSAVKQIESGAFDVVLTDLRMPGLDGLELTKRVKASQPRVEVILMTGYASLETAAEGMRLGAYDYISKPFGNIDLVATSIKRAREKQTLAARARQLEQHLTHSDRLAAIGQLAAGVAHEINNPAGFVLANLTVMKHLIDELRKLNERVKHQIEIEPDPQRAATLAELFSEPDMPNLLYEFDEMIADNLEGIRRISSIVTDLRTFARIDRDDIELVRVDEVAEAAINICRSEIRHRAKLVTTINEVRPVAAHRGKLAQVMVNLLVNAAHAMADPTDGKNRVSVSCGQDSESVYFAVEDNGKGMSSEVRDRIFEPFFTTKPRSTGTGLGLSLSAEIVRQHGGTITVTSQPGRGSRFEVRLPGDTGLTPRQVNTPLMKPAPKRRRRILVIDDEPLLLNACRRMLEPLHDVTLAHDGGEALAILEDDREFDVLLCDLMMPGVDGAKFYHTLQAQAPQLVARVLFTSGGAVTPLIKDFAAELGPNLLEKPFTSEQLHNALERTLAQAQAEPVERVDGE